MEFGQKNMAGRGIVAAPCHKNVVIGLVVWYIGHALFCGIDCSGRKFMTTAIKQGLT
jgi:hypothetical protein